VPRQKAIVSDQLRRDFDEARSLIHALLATRRRNLVEQVFELNGLRGKNRSAIEQMARRMAVEEGIFAGISAAGACEVALRVSQTVENALIVFIICDRGDRYLSTGVFPA